MALMHMHTNTGFHVKLIYNGGPAWGGEQTDRGLD